MGNRGEAWSYEVDPGTGVTSVGVSGVVTAIDIAAAQDHLAADPRFEPTFGLIIDLSGVSEVPITWLQARSIVLRSPVAVAAPRAFVANTILAAAMAHAFRAVRVTLTGTDAVRICGSMAEARGWLTSYRNATAPRPH